VCVVDGAGKCCHLTINRGGGFANGTSLLKFLIMFAHSHSRWPDQRQVDPTSLCMYMHMHIHIRMQCFVSRKKRPRARVNIEASALLKLKLKLKVKARVAHFLVVRAAAAKAYASTQNQFLLCSSGGSVDTNCCSIHAHPFVQKCPYTEAKASFCENNEGPLGLSLFLSDPERVWTFCCRPS
jgi:hypothetical protein